MFNRVIDLDFKIKSLKSISTFTTVINDIGTKSLISKIELYFEALYMKYLQLLDSYEFPEAQEEFDNIIETVEDLIAVYENLKAHMAIIERKPLHLNCNMLFLFNKFELEEWCEAKKDFYIFSIKNQPLDYWQVQILEELLYEEHICETVLKKLVVCKKVINRFKPPVIIENDYYYLIKTVCNYEIEILKEECQDINALEKEIFELDCSTQELIVLANKYTNEYLHFDKLLKKNIWGLPAYLPIYENNFIVGFKRYNNFLIDSDIQLYQLHEFYYYNFQSFMLDYLKKWLTKQGLIDSRGTIRKFDFALFAEHLKSEIENSIKFSYEDEISEEAVIKDVYFCIKQASSGIYVKANNIYNKILKLVNNTIQIDYFGSIRLTVKYEVNNTSEVFTDYNEILYIFKKLLSTSKTQIDENKS